MEKEKTDVLRPIKMMLFMWILIVLLMLLVRHEETVNAAKEAAKKMEAVVEKKEKKETSSYEKSKEVPVYFQHDSKWGSIPYAGGTIADSGCGPTCLSMVLVYLTGDETKTPEWVAEFSTKEGYIEDGKTSWKMMSEGAKKLGLNVEQLPKSEEGMKQVLEDGKVIICSMGPGAFTKTGHFIAITGCENGEFTVNDPNSRENCEKKWKYSEFEDQMKNIWVYWK